MPFDRLVRAVDEWATQRHRSDVFAQIGPSNLKPRTIKTERFLAPEEFRSRLHHADIVVAHAGMGSIITALELGKPIIVMPRRGSLSETRNDHQVDTAEFFQKAGRVTVAYDEHELISKLDDIDLTERFEPIASHASPELINNVRTFLVGARKPGRTRSRK